MKTTDKQNFGGTTKSIIGYFGRNGLFPNRLKPRFQSEAKCKAIDKECFFYSHANKSHFYNKGFVLILVLKVRVFGTRKSPHNG